MRRFRTFLVLLLTGAAALGLTVLAHSDSDISGQEALKERIRVLEEENAELRAAIESQKSTIEALKRALVERRTVLHPSPGPGEVHLPEGATPFEYNGMTFYIIPADPKR